MGACKEGGGGHNMACRERIGLEEGWQEGGGGQKTVSSSTVSVCIKEGWENQETKGVNTL